jgi:hypothetical protein
MRGRCFLFRHGFWKNDVLFECEGLSFVVLEARIVVLECAAVVTRFSGSFGFFFQSFPNLLLGQRTLRFIWSEDVASGFTCVRWFLTCLFCLKSRALFNRLKEVIFL